ncbi:N-6 DNA methylase [Arthrobacter sp. IA7]|uniref:type ISP restriction/modification enzyme n=1 Tax=Arthrobacter ipis TaxID=2716202 RepID=UPI0016833541|nr:type ISP restriction/modification enzyme [Arthrobacter ipis]MBD1542249.1 N-6 DNA methylase [Arthrobacter ipis]
MSGSERAIDLYVGEILQQLATGHAREHAYRPAFKDLMESLENIRAVNDPKRSENGNPDFIFLSASNAGIVRGYAEAKDVTVSLSSVSDSEQMRRYAGYKSLILTNYIDFIFYRAGEAYKTVSLGTLSGSQLVENAGARDELLRELKAFVQLPPAAIRSGSRLSAIMGSNALRIRESVSYFLSENDDPTGELQRMHKVVKNLLVHDLSIKDFADMYAQTLVYGLFIARYGDESPENFSRAEARELIPATNPFLRSFFDHIAGTGFDVRLRYIIDDLCDVFRASDVRYVVNRHLGVRRENGKDPKDPIIHFYEDFLASYDPDKRRALGVYYTPRPVVKFIVRRVNDVLIQHFGITDGLADTTQTKAAVALQGKTKTVSLPRVQILDPATGTATFLDQIVRFVRERFEGQEGAWSTYAKSKLLPRLHGFELMMASYTVGHLKLGMTLAETGVTGVTDRLGIYLTNTLEEGSSAAPDLFSTLGLSAAITEEARRAAELKNDHPVMVVIGNPPYSGVSYNKTAYADGLIAAYKREPGSKSKLKEKKHRLDDDYVKFMAFAESVINRNGDGVMAMITNHGYIDNASYRGMRWHLMKSFDHIYIYDLHGNMTKKEVQPNGLPDENVFDIRQGVSIIIACKNGDQGTKLARVYHTDLWGTRQEKFDFLDSGVQVDEIEPHKPLYLFNRRTFENAAYEDGVQVDQLFTLGSSGVQTSRDSLVVDFTKEELISRLKDLSDIRHTDQEVRDKYFPKAKSAKFLPGDTRGWRLAEKRVLIRKSELEEDVRPYGYRPFDKRYAGIGPLYADWPRTSVMSNMDYANVSLVVGREGKAVGDGEWNIVFVEDVVSDLNLFYRGGGVVMPLYRYASDGRFLGANIDSSALKQLLRKIGRYQFSDVISDDAEDAIGDSITPLQVFDYVYGILHSTEYRQANKNYLDVAFPKITPPENKEFFVRTAATGRKIRRLHLGLEPLPHNLGTTYPVAGSNVVGAIKRQDSKIWINDTQYFGGIDDETWETHVGGYQVMHKWLKDRIGRELTDDDIRHFQTIAYRLRAVREAVELYTLEEAVAADEAGTPEVTEGSFTG